MNILKNKIALGIIAVIAIGLFIIYKVPQSNKRAMISNTKVGSVASDLVITKDQITETAKFYPYSVDGQKMEVLALKASDGTIRIAFNTCQVCFDSGRGYYVQEGNELVCQNCGNRFSADQVEIVKGGCNPVPITSDNKKDDGKNITISKDFLAQNKGLFANWKTR